MDKVTLIKRAEAFQALHRREELFLLPNIWNPGSAVIFEKQGFPALATTSAGIAYALGFPDGEDIHLEDLILVVRQINRRISLPLSVDFERGYAESPQGVKENARRLLEVGVSGFNIEDGRSDGSLDELPLMLEKIGALAELREETGVPFVINARSCCWWLRIGSEADRNDTALERGNAFASSGADCVFIPGLLPEDAARTLASGIDAPLNLIANPVFNDKKKMGAMGVRRLSIGSGAVRACYARLLDIAAGLKDGDWGEMFAHPLAYAAANDLFRENS
jgi:2-methylisocitrate lyase-like PEP mutase family enzyme